MSRDRIKLNANFALSYQRIHIAPPTKKAAADLKKLAEAEEVVITGGAGKKRRRGTVITLGEKAGTEPVAYPV